MPGNVFDKIPPELAGVALAMVISFLRIVYDHQETRPIRIILESLICGALSLTAFYGVKAMGLDVDWSIFVGGAIGYLGPTSIRALLLKVINRRIDG